MFLFAWAIGEGIIIYRWIKNGAPPAPGALLLPSALFLSLAILAEYEPARTTATAFAYAVDLAVLVQVVGKEPKQATGWPPPKIPATQIWPGGSSAPAASSTSAASSSSTAANAASNSSKIIKVISELPGFGFVK